MSWLKTRLGKVRERGADVVKESQRLRLLQERAAQVVRSAGDAVRLRAVSAADLEMQLEKRAQGIQTVAAVEEMHRSWVEELDQPTGVGHRTEEGGRQLSFKEVFLRSHALELSIELIASDSTLRLAYTAVLDDTSGNILPRLTHLDTLLARTQCCPAEFWREVLRIGMHGDGLPDEDRVTWLVSIVGALKSDWMEEAYRTERDALADRIKQLQEELSRPLPGLPATGSGWEQVKAQRQRAAVVRDLLQAQNAMQSNLRESQAQRDEARMSRETVLSLVGEQVEALAMGLASSEQAITDHHQQLDGSLQQSQTAIQSQLGEMDSQRGAIDSELEGLENRKRDLKIELDQVSQKLDVAIRKQRQHLVKCDAQRKEFDVLKAGFGDRVHVEADVICEADRQRAIIERAESLVHDVDTKVQGVFEGRAEEMRDALAVATAAGQGSMGCLLERLGELRQQASAGGSHQVQPAELEKFKREHVLPAVDAERRAFEKFKRDHAELLAKSDFGSTVVQRLDAEHMTLIGFSRTLIGYSSACFTPPPRN